MHATIHEDDTGSIYRATLEPSSVKKPVPDGLDDRTPMQRLGPRIAQDGSTASAHNDMDPIDLSAPQTWTPPRLPRAEQPLATSPQPAGRSSCQDVTRSARGAARIRATMNAESLRRRPKVVDESAEQFAEFVKVDGLRLRRIMTARYGVEAGGDIHAESMAWAWQNWAKLQAMENPVGYLYRVAQSSARPHHRWLRRTSFPSKFPERWHLDEDSSLFNSLSSLSEAQRVSVLMVHGHQWTYAEVAEALECSVSAVTNHVHRGLATLRRQLESEEP
jgi:DNA-directed RNA polymerase specialized sigma24 family protein